MIKINSVMACSCKNNSQNTQPEGVKQVSKNLGSSNEIQVNKENVARPKTKRPIIIRRPI